MNAENRPSAMRLKAGAMRPPPEIDAVSPSKALRTALAQAAEDVAALRAVVGRVDEARTTLAPFTEALSPAALLALVEGPDSRFGLVVLDAQAVAALIEIQTTGRVVSRPAEERPPTRTDAIMCADFIDRVLELLEARVTEADLDLAPALSGFRYAMALPDARAVGMTLEDLPYRHFSCSLDLASGAKSGRLDLILPYELRGTGHHGPADTAAFSQALEAQVLRAEAELTAVLHRRRMPISAVADLAPGALIPVPRSALGQVALVDLLGQTVAHGRLGQSAGNRAVRLVFEDEVVAEDDTPGLPPSAAPPGLPPPAGAPDLGSLGDLGDLGDLGNAGDLGDLGSLGDTGDLPDLGSLGTPGEAGDLPDLGSLGSLGEPEDLPDLETLGTLGGG